MFSSLGTLKSLYCPERVSDKSTILYTFVKDLVSLALAEKKGSI